MIRTPTQKTLFQKQIPTILGLVILVVALIAGVFLIGEGPGVFAPRATAETTPRNVRITNVTDSSFTISFLTQDSTPGFVKYGTEAGRLNSQSSDDRDQLTGTVGQYKTHHITVRGLNPNTQYFYELGTGSGATFDDSGAPFAIQTAQRSGAPSAAKTAYGSVSTPNSTPADGAIVYLSIEGVGEMSSLVKATGSWAIPLSNARSSDGSGYATIGDEDVMNVLIQGEQPSLQSQFSIEVAQSQPVADIVIGQTPDGSMAMVQETEMGTGDLDVIDPTENIDGNDDAMNQNLATDSASMTASESAIVTASDSAMVGGTDINASPSANTTTETPEETTVNPGGLGSLIDEPTPEKTELNLDSDEGAVLTTGNPKLKGTAAPGVTVKMVVNSDTQITQDLIANDDGTFELDIAALSEQLEPGEHDATYSYIDPTTGELVTKTVTFTVEEPGTGGTQMLAQANQPFSTSSPVPVSTSSSTTTATQSATATESADTGKGGATRSAMPATNSAIPVSGSVGTTLALVLGGLFFILAGGWSFWLAHEIERV